MNEITEIYLEWLCTMLTKGGVFLRPDGDWYIVCDQALSATETVKLKFQLTHDKLLIEAHYNGVHGEATYTTHLDRMWTGNTFEDCAKVERAWIYSCSRVDTWHTLAYGLARPIGDLSVWWHKKEV